MEAPDRAGDGQAPGWAAVPTAAEQRAFQELSSEAAETLIALKASQVTPGRP